MPGWPLPLHCHAEEKSWRHTAQEIHLPPTEGERWAYIIMKVSQSAFVISCAGIVWTQKKNKNCEVYSIYSGRKLHEPYILDNGPCGKKYKHMFGFFCVFVFGFFPIAKNCINTLFFYMYVQMYSWLSSGQSSRSTFQSPPTLPVWTRTTVSPVGVCSWDENLTGEAAQHIFFSYCSQSTWLICREAPYKYLLINLSLPQSNKYPHILIIQGLRALGSHLS